MKRRGVMRSALRAFGQVLERPHHLLAFLLLNLVLAVVVALPYQVLLGDRLERAPVAEEIADGASWRWLDTLLRQRPEILGTPGLEWPPRPGGMLPAQTLAAGLLLYWLTAILHCGYLSTLRSGPSGRRGLFASAARFALPATALALLAGLGYLAMVALLFVGTGRLTEPLAAATDREWVALALTWGRAALTLAGLLAVKLVFDLAKTVVVRRDSLNFLGAGVEAVSELGRRGLPYLAAYLLIALPGLALIALWWLLPGRVVPGSWAGLAALFLFQQIFLAARIAFRLAHLGATWNLYPRRL